MSGGQRANPGYQEKYQPQADVAYNSLLNANLPYAQQLPGQVVPQAQGFTQSIINNPYTAQQQTGINQAAATGMNTIAPQTIGQSQALNAYGQSALPYGQQILNTGFDPQNALYNRTYQQVIDQQNAINSMYGLGASPYGAGVTGQVGSNFNIDWQNAQLGRQAQALQGYGALGSDVSGLFGQSSNLGNAGLQTMTTAAQLPYQSYNTQYQNDINALGGYSNLVGSSMSPSQSMLGDLSQYLSLGQSATRNQQNAAQINNAADASAWQGIGGLAGNLFGSMFNPFGGSGGSSMLPSFMSAGIG